MAGEKTERATPRRLEDARRRGQVARSMDLNGAVILLAGLLALTVVGPSTVGAMEGAMRDIFARLAEPQAALSARGLEQLALATMRTVAFAVGPIAGICVIAAVIANLSQVGIKPTPGALRPQPKRLDPIQGAKNVFGMRMLFEGGKSLLKVGVVGVIVALAVIPKLTELAATVGASPALLSSELWSMVLSLLQRAAIAYLAIAVIDFAYQKWHHAKQLRMSVQDVKDEYRSQNLPAEVRAAQRRRMLQQARARMMAAVPEADVVVTNPTHFAVALSYDGTKPAPVVVAKGQDLVALQIRRIAEEHGVPVVENRPLARSLHASVELGQMIPEELYQAVAQVLAYVYRVAGKARRRIAVR